MQTKLQGKLLLGTNNAGKLLELRQLLAGLENVQLVSLKEAGIDFDVAETGATYQENAALKSEAYAQAAGLVALADDSGLEVDALDGAPGLYSKRFSPKPNATDADRRAYLLEKLAARPRPWTARFRALVAITVPGDEEDGQEGETLFAEGTCEGEIIPEERGSNGFGYDPIFYIPAFGKTMAELSDEEKNRVSHRGNAVRAAADILAQVFGLR